MNGPLKRGIVALGSAAIIVLAAVSPAAAHVTASTNNAAAGSYTLITFGFGHGCGDSATTEVSIQIPEQFATVTPGINYGWNVEKVYENLATPVSDGHGGEYTERVSEVVYTAKEPVPNGFYDSFQIQLQLPEDAAGETIYFPVVQTCEEGETAWIQIPAEGESSNDLDSPAPSITVTESTGDGH
jgi:periplasmic copper chaperone A